MPLFSPPAPTPNLVTVIAASGASQTLSAAGQLDPAFDVTLTANCTFALAANALARVQSIVVRLTQDSTGGRVPTFPANVMWDLGTIPAFSTTPGVKDTVVFTTWDGGATWEGTIVKLGSVVPGVPDAPTATVLPGHGQARLYIFDGLPHGSAVTAHAIYRSTTSGFTPGPSNLVATYATSSGFIYTDTGLTDGTPYYYVVAAINSTGPSAFSAQYTVTPSNNRYLNGTANTNVFTSAVPAANLVTEGYGDWQSYVALTDITATNALISRWSTGGAVYTNSAFFNQVISGAPSIAYFDTSSTTVHVVTCGTTFAQALAANPALTYLANGTPFWIRTVLSVGASTVNGFAAGTATFFTAPDNGYGQPGTWTQLGATVTGLTTNGMREPSSTPLFTVGTLSSSNAFVGKFFKAILYTSTGSTKMAVDFTSLFSGQTGTFNDNATTPNSFTINGTGAIN